MHFSDVSVSAGRVVFIRATGSARRSQRAMLVRFHCIACVALRDAINAVSMQRSSSVEGRWTEEQLLARLLVVGCWSIRLKIIIIGP